MNGFLTGRRLCFVINNAAFFVSHRLSIALAARKAGAEIDLITGSAGVAALEESALQLLVGENIPHQRVAFKTDSINPIIEAIGLLQICRLLSKGRPHLVHCASPKGILYGGLAARIMGVRGLVLAVSGMGYAFTPTAQKNFTRRMVAKVYKTWVRLAYGHNNKRVIVQNHDDLRAIVDAGLAEDREMVLIPGSGVDIEKFSSIRIESKQPVVLLPARMLVDKGVLEFIEAARRLKPIVGSWRFVLAGAADYKNPSSISTAQVEAWVAEGIVEWRGHIEHADDMVALYAQASIVCLPSYREGMPKCLLEAAAAGCAVVTTDAVGCRESILPGETGDLVPIRDSAALATALLSLINDADRRRRYGIRGQQLAADRFGIDAVVAATLNIYKELLIHEHN